MWKILGTNTSYSLYSGNHDCDELRINHLPLLLVVTVPYARWFLWRADYTEDFLWRLHFQYGVACWRVVLREVYFEGPNRVWRALKTSILNIEVVYFHTSIYLPTILLHWVPMPMPMPTHAHRFWVGMDCCWLVWSRYGYKFEGNVGLYYPPTFQTGRLLTPLLFSLLAR